MQFDHRAITELCLRSQQRGLLTVSLNISSAALVHKPRHSFSSPVLPCTDTPASSAPGQEGQETRAARCTPRTAAGRVSQLFRCLLFHTATVVQLQPRGAKVL
ncbi:uncharacterized protein LOC134547238 isoform X3 [Prinia subflava]|uniref:uncharacterized protein LOC134547238 isoform X3 n=1 Tax=Prinia subflava TaxID=208062 RepID=UPI002FE41C47